MRTNFIQALVVGTAFAGTALAGGAAAAQAIHSSAPMQSSEDRAEVDGTSMLTRMDDGIAMTLDTRHLGRNAPYTVWWVVFNNPELCDVSCGCGAVDLNNPEVEAGQFWATGRVADRFGQAAFAAMTGTGELPEGEGQVPHPVATSPLLHPEDAEVHMVVRGHGRFRWRDREEQLTTLNGGCPPNHCTNVQFTIHPSPTCTPIG